MSTGWEQEPKNCIGRRNQSSSHQKWSGQHSFFDITKRHGREGPLKVKGMDTVPMHSSRPLGGNHFRRMLFRLLTLVVFVIPSTVHLDTLESYIVNDRRRPIQLWAKWGEYNQRCRRFIESNCWKSCSLQFCLFLYIRHLVVCIYLVLFLSGQRVESGQVVARHLRWQLEDSVCSWFSTWSSRLHCSVSRWMNHW